MRTLTSSAGFPGAAEAVIITNDEEQTIRTDGITIRVQPAWKWLLAGGGGAADGDGSVATP